MDIKSMIKREDFYPILFRSLETYFKDVLDCDVKVSCEHTKGAERLYVFSPPSYISRRKNPKGLLTFLYSEYNIRSNFIKFLLGKFGVFIATHSNGYAALSSIYLDPIGVLPENSFIVPNNRSIRIFNYETMMVDCVIKDTFTNKYFLNQLNFRRENNYSFVPPLVDFGDNWFRETIMLGNALARVTNKKSYHQSIDSAIKYMGIIAKETIEVVNSKNYYSNLTADLRYKIDEAVRRKQIKSKGALLATIRHLENTLQLSNLRVPLVLGHGDLQTGNIWLDKNGKTWIYDWETNGIRSIWYDSATLLLSLRRKGGIENMWRNRESEQVVRALLYNDEIKTYTSLQLSQIVSIVLLEDIQFYLDDLLELPNDFGGSIFDLFAKRLIALNYNNTI